MAVIGGVSSINANSTTASEAKKFTESRLPHLSPRDEVDLYVGQSKGKEIKHLIRFANRWERYGIAKSDSISLFEQSPLSDIHPLTSTITAIALTRWLRDGHDNAPVGCDSLPPDQPILSQMFQYSEDLTRRIEARYRGSELTGQDTEFSAQIDNFIRDTQETALYLIASSYKNQRKYYAGVDALAKISSNVALVFIEILNAAYDLLLLNGMNPTSDSLSPRIQSEAVYRVSENWYRQIPHDYDFGITQQDLLRELGSQYRKIQLELAAPRSCPNGFSVSSEIWAKPGDDSLDPRKSPKLLLQESVSWGLFEVDSHQDKTPGRPKRRRFRMNRVFCPYFGISPLIKKDPIYIDDIETFVSDLLSGKQPIEFTKFLQRAKKYGDDDEGNSTDEEVDDTPDGQQRRLF